MAFDGHLFELLISRAQQALGLCMLGPGMKNFCLTMQQYPTKARPVLIIITVDDEGDETVLSDVAQPLQRLSLLTFRLVIDGDVYAIARKRIAHGYDVRHAGGVRCR